MPPFLADLHIHSRHSRATSRALTPRHLAAWALAKGIHVLGTGDFTHPGWLAELEEALEPREDTGLYRLRDPRGLDKEIPWLEGALPASLSGQAGHASQAGEPRFMLQAEISSIYKRGGAVRKIHNLVFVPDFATARKLNARLGAIGNLAADGRPILGLDARDLLEIVLEMHPQAFLVPAHVWTPWFSLFGSKSGFDSIQDCFGDLARHVFALETGLSSDPEMNWRISALDRFSLLSNSDAHSGEKLGRECNVFQGERSYAGILHALRREGLSHQFLGTIEFFPEEGKYHHDGHRACGVQIDPAREQTPGDRCPVCGKPLTVGVLHRVLELADRPAPVQPPGQPGFTSLFPLSECLAEILDAGVNTKKVRQMYAKVLRRLGPELTVLRDVPLEDARAVDPRLGEALERMRAGRVIRQAGYDGEFGVIRVFTEEERRAFRSGGARACLVTRPVRPAKRDLASLPAPKPELAPLPVSELGPDGAAPEAEPLPDGLNARQLQAATAGPGPVLVLAGPGTGKTHTLLARCLRLLDDGVPASEILLVTYTRKAAAELRERLQATLRAAGEDRELPRADTLHALACEVWTAGYGGDPPTIMDDAACRRLFREAALSLEPDLPRREIDRRFEACNLARERLQRLDQWDAILLAYAKRKEHWNLADFTDLLEFWLQSIQTGSWTSPWTQVLVDEVQDLTPLQLRCICKLLPLRGDGLFAIGDPDQSIYGFRGADGEVEETLVRRWPGLIRVALEASYRAAPALLDMAGRMFPSETFPGRPAIAATRRAPGLARCFEAPGAEAEAQWVTQQIRQLVGDGSHSQADRAAGSLADSGLAGTLAPGDVAVLTRLTSLLPPFRAALHAAGLPVSAPEVEAFWKEPRVAVILAAVEGMLGLGEVSGEAPDEAGERAPSIPEPVLAGGPHGLPKALGSTPPFDALFWESAAFRELRRAFTVQGTWQALVNWLHLQREEEQVRRVSQSIRLMTLHAAKGLEFRAVFLPCLEDGIMPFAGPGFLSGHVSADATPPDFEEERRLCYVGLTRAMDALFLSRSRQRSLHGRVLRLPASRFLPSVLAHPACQASALTVKTRRRETPLSLLG